MPFQHVVWTDTCLFTSPALRQLVPRAFSVSKIT